MRILCVLLVCCALAAADTPLGKPLTLKKTTPIEKLASKPGDYVGKTVQAKGKVAEVCQKMGCWMNLVDPKSAKMIRIKVKDGEIVFPKESIGKMALAEGQMVKIDLTREQAVAMARHEAEENQKPFDPGTVTGPRTIYQIKATGAVILD
jgi:NACalpha-BTF3-like transcription factor